MLFNIVVIRNDAKSNKFESIETDCMAKSTDLIHILSDLHVPTWEVLRASGLSARTRLTIIHTDRNEQMIFKKYYICIFRIE